MNLILYLFMIYFLCKSTYPSKPTTQDIIAIYNIDCCTSVLLLLVMDVRAYTSFTRILREYSRIVR